ncbi:MAG: glycine--tRNA ligase [Desulfurococcaceae archaeon]
MSKPRVIDLKDQSETNMQNKYEKIMDLAKKRGLFWPSFEAYGGIAGFYDFGPVGVLLKRNIMNLWLRYFVYTQAQVIEIETPLINPSIVFKASGHEEHFTDPIIECSKCHKIYRADHLIKDVIGINVEGLNLSEIDRTIKEHNLKCPECGGDFNPAFYTQLLFITEIGPYRGDRAYLRPEHAQGMFINFQSVLRFSRNKLPVGVAQVGKVARNEISPRQGLLRLREFNIMELEFFFDPEEAEKEIQEVLSDVAEEKLRVIFAGSRVKKIEEPQVLAVKELIENKLVKTPWLAYWMGVGNKFIKSLGIQDDKIRFVEKFPHERAHYSMQTFDQEVYTSRFGWIEIAGYAYRTSYDLEQHAKYSEGDYTYFKRYDEPLTVHIERAYPNPTLIERNVGSEKLAEIMRQLSMRSPEDLYKELESRGYVAVMGINLPSECFFVRKEETKLYGKKIYPHVAEPSFGLERLLYVVLDHSYDEREGKSVLKVPPYIAPYHAAVFPLLVGKKPEHQKMVSISREIYRGLLKCGFRVFYDEEGSIGRRYARADEIGVPFAITVDHQTLEDSTVTVRDRNTTQQIRVKTSELEAFLMSHIGNVAIIY